MRQPTHIVVLGAGFGGLEATLQLEQSFRDDASIDLAGRCRLCQSPAPEPIKEEVS